MARASGVCRKRSGILRFRSSMRTVFPPVLANRLVACQKRVHPGGDLQSRGDIGVERLFQLPDALQVPDHVVQPFVGNHDGTVLVGDDHVPRINLLTANLHLNAECLDPAGHATGRGTASWKAGDAAGRGAGGRGAGGRGREAEGREAGFRAKAGLRYR